MGDYGFDEFLEQVAEMLGLSRLSYLHIDNSTSLEV